MEIISIGDDDEETEEVIVKDKSNQSDCVLYGNIFSTR